MPGSVTRVDVDPRPDPTDPSAGPNLPRRRLRDRLVVRLAALFLLLLVTYVAFTFLQVWQASQGDDAAKADAIIVLGAAQYDGRPSPILRARLAHALELYRAGRAPMLVVTGGRQQGDRFTESTTGYNWLRARGVPDEAILKEVKGRNTWESLRAVARFLEPRNVNDVILVSDASHTKRLEGIAHEVGLQPHVSPERTIHRSTQGTTRALARETAAVSIGRLLGYGRLTRLVG